MGKKVQQKQFQKKISKIIKRLELSPPILTFRYTLNNYSVYSIYHSNNLIAYAGIFEDGKFNYVVLDDIYLEYENSILELIHNEIYKKGLVPFLNPRLYQSS